MERYQFRVLWLLCAAFAIAALVCTAPPLQPAASAVQPYFDAGPDAVDLNRAPAAELASLPGIGDKKAQSIVAYRAAHGDFTDVRQLVRVPGITYKIAAEVRPFVTLKQEA